MPKFNYELWKAGQKIEDNLKPKIDKFFECDFKRNSNIFDILDFHDEEKKKIVEVKGRNMVIPSDAEVGDSWKNLKKWGANA